MKAAGAAPKACWWWGKDVREEGEKVSSGSLRPIRLGSGLGAGGDPPSVSRSDTVPTEDEEEEDEDGENKNYGDEKL